MINEMEEKEAYASVRAKYLKEINAEVESKVFVLLHPLRDELGIDESIRKGYTWSVNEIIGLAIAEIRTLRSRLSRAKIEFRKMEKALHEQKKIF